MGRQGERSQFGDPRASLTHLAVQLTFVDSVYGVHAPKSVRLSVQGVLCWLGTSRAPDMVVGKGSFIRYCRGASPDHMFPVTPELSTVIE